MFCVDRCLCDRLGQASNREGSSRSSDGLKGMQSGRPMLHRSWTTRIVLRLVLLNVLLRVPQLTTVSETTPGDLLDRWRPPWVVVFDV